MYLDRVDSETSGSGERIFDASRHSFNDLFLLEIIRPYENWMVLGRSGHSVDYIDFERLGLDPSDEYIVFSFWDKKYLGSFYRGFLPGDIDPVYKSQLFCIRRKEAHPQLVATNRHISCGALELEDVEWKNMTLSGESELVANDEYVIYLTEPGNYRLKEIRIDGQVNPVTSLGSGIREIHMESPVKKNLKWEIIYTEK
jgi:hypothetical protein